MGCWCDRNEPHGTDHDYSQHPFLREEAEMDKHARQTVKEYKEAVEDGEFELANRIYYANLDLEQEFWRVTREVGKKRR